MCPKGLSIVELLNSPYRLVQPMLKQGSEWKTISYAEAVDIVVDKLRQSRAKLINGMKTSGKKRDNLGSIGKSFRRGCNSIAESATKKEGNQPSFFVGG